MRFASLALLLVSIAAVFAAPAARAQEGPFVAIVPVPGQNVGPDVGRPVLRAVQDALVGAAPSTRFRVAGDQALVTAIMECADPSCRGELVARTGGFAAVLVYLDRPDASGPVAVRLEPIALPGGEALTEAAQVQVPAATLSSPEAAQAVIGATVPAVAQALPAPPPAAPQTARVLVAVNADRAEVTLDGEAVGETPLAPFEVEPGRHIIAVQAVGFENYSRSIEIPAEGLRIDVYLEPTADQAEELAARDAREAEGYAASSPEGEWYEKWWVWVAAGAGVAVLTAAIVGIAIAVGGDDTQEGFPVPPIPVGEM